MKGYRKLVACAAVLAVLFSGVGPLTFLAGAKEGARIATYFEDEFQTGYTIGTRVSQTPARYKAGSTLPDQWSGMAERNNGSSITGNTATFSAAADPANAANTVMRAWSDTALASEAGTRIEKKFLPGSSHLVEFSFLFKMDAATAQAAAGAENNKGPRTALYLQTRGLTTGQGLMLFFRNGGIYFPDGTYAGALVTMNEEIQWTQWNRVRLVADTVSWKVSAYWGDTTLFIDKTINGTPDTSAPAEVIFTISPTLDAPGRNIYFDDVSIRDGVYFADDFEWGAEPGTRLLDAPQKYQYNDTGLLRWSNRTERNNAENDTAHVAVAEEDETPGANRVLKVFSGSGLLSSTEPAVIKRLVYNESESGVAAHFSVKRPDEAVSVRLRIDGTTNPNDNNRTEVFIAQNGFVRAAENSGYSYPVAVDQNGWTHYTVHISFTDWSVSIAQNGVTLCRGVPLKHAFNGPANYNLIFSSFLGSPGKYMYIDDVRIEDGNEALTPRGLDVYAYDGGPAPDPAETLTDGSFAGSVYIDNNSYTDRSVALVAGIYEGSRLETVKILPYSAKALEALRIYTEPLQVTQSADKKIRVFLWTGIPELIPLMQDEELAGQ